MESLSDIERDLRDRADCAERHGDRETHNDGVATLLRSIADRIEAIDSADAWRSLYTPGNAAAMREALVWMRDRMVAAVYDGSFDCDEALCKIEAALSAPARQCDVGTAEEQAERYGRYCDKFAGDGMHCESCPCCGKIPFGKCEFAWAQTPYAEEGAGK